MSRDAAAIPGLSILGVSTVKSRHHFSKSRSSTPRNTFCRSGNETTARLTESIGGATEKLARAEYARLHGVAVENLTASESRIRDADIAELSSDLVAANILQSAGVSVLAQANQSSQAALSLLR